MQMTIGPLTLTLKYAIVRKDTGSIVYERPVPKALQGHFSGKLIKEDLRTKDWRVATPKVLERTKRDTALFAALKNSGDVTPPAVRARAAHLLKVHGVTPGDTASPAADTLLDQFNAFLDAYAQGDEERYRDAVPSEFLPPVQLEALKLMQGKQSPVNQVQDVINAGHLDGRRH